MYMTPITITELRKNLKQYLETALSGTPVFIERAGTIFKLCREGYVMTSTLKDLVVSELEFINGEGGEVLTMQAQVIEAEYCKNGHRLPQGREKCLQKRCKSV